MINPIDEITENLIAGNRSIGDAFVLLELVRELREKNEKLEARITNIETYLSTLSIGTIAKEK